MTTRVEHDTKQIVIIRKQDKFMCQDAKISKPPGAVRLPRRGVMLGVRRGGGGGGGNGNGIKYMRTRTDAPSECTLFYEHSPAQGWTDEGY